MHKQKYLIRIPAGVFAVVKHVLFSVSFDVTTQNRADSERDFCFNLYLDHCVKHSITYFVLK